VLLSEGRRSGPEAEAEDEDEAGAIAERGDAWGGGAAACTGARGVARGSHDSRVGAQ